jgi:hypothetical protein
MDQIFQVAGAALILVAFIAAQRNAMSPHSAVYLALNLVGSIVLTAVALHGQDWGFFALEFVWAVVSGWGLWQLTRGQMPTAAH